MNIFSIGDRLKACAALVRDGAVLADIGTDHGYLPIYLLDENRIDRAVLSDINKGPLAKAEENVTRRGYRNRVSLVLCDGASALSGCGATDYCICGMGGELIADIIAAAPHLKNNKIRLILQPMSKQEVLRNYLFNSGFSILKEVYSFDEGKYYVTVLAEYSGERVEFSAVDAYFGKMNVLVNSEAVLGYMKTKARSLESVIKGKREGGVDTSTEEHLLTALEERFGIRSSL